MVVCRDAGVVFPHGQRPSWDGSGHLQQRCVSACCAVSWPVAPRGLQELSTARNVSTTAQFTSKLFYPDRTQPFLWSSDSLQNFGFTDDRFDFFADSCSVELSQDGNTYHVKSAVNPKSLIDVKITKAAPGFVAGKDGTSYYGPDPNNPLGSMHHAFWPRCTVEGKFFTEDGEVDMKGSALFVHAVQGMKPHHAGEWPAPLMTQGR